MKLNDIDIRFKIPDIPSSVTIFNLSPKSFKTRKPALEQIGKRFNFGKTFTIEAEESMFIVSKEGLIEFYGPSGAFCARNVAADSKYKDEKRSWKTETRKTDEGPELILDEKAKSSLEADANDILKEMELTSDHSYLEGISLEQVGIFKPDTKEEELFSGEATVRFLYQLDKIPVEGGGAKSYLDFHPKDDGGELVGLYHAWREPVETKSVELMDIESSFKLALKRDKELQRFSEKEHSIRFDGAKLAYYTLPPYKRQHILIPVIQVSGAVLKKTKEGQRGHEFLKYYHAVDPRNYVDLESQALYLAARL